MCGICGGEIHVTGDGDLHCLGPCGAILTREEIEAADLTPPFHPQAEEYEDYEADVVDEWRDGKI